MQPSHLLLASALSVAALVATVTTPPALAEDRAPTARIVATLQGPDGGWDYASVDPQLGRLYVAREYGVMTVDLKTHRVTERFVTANDVAAVMPIPGGDLMLGTVNRDDQVLLFDRRTGARIAVLPAGVGPDAATYDAQSSLAFVMNGESGNVTVVDPVRRKVVGTVVTGDKPEAAVADGHGHVFVNLEESATLARIDIATLEVTRRTPLAGCIEPTGLAFDATSGLLVSACHNGIAKLTDAATGADRGGLPIGRDADGAIFDASRRLGIIPANDGTLTLFTLGASGRVGAVGTIMTTPGARAAAFDATTGRIYLPAGEYRLDGTGKRSFVSGSFRVVVVELQ